MAGNRKQGQVRIIGGDWRGRKLPVADRPGLRPTSDRIRETVFNWLQHRVVGARVLDAFAGSGALAFEALSRGARHADLIEADRDVAATLNRYIKLLDATARVLNSDSYVHLQQAATATYDLVFLDPPFADVDLSVLLLALAEHGWLAPEAVVYIEQPRDRELLLPAGWEAWREKRAGGVQFGLFMNVVEGVT
ncbi:MAG: 16S rRNA (guanine(966)-N(2))-methyltransferase RsmD [Pseudomonadota bacterium]